MRPRSQAARPIGRRASPLAIVPLLAALAGVLPGCAAEPALPEGAYVSGHGAALVGVLERLAALSGTPLGRVAEASLARVAACRFVSAHAPDGDLEALAARLACADEASEPAAVAKARADADWLLLAPAGPGRRVRLLGRAQPGGALAMDVAIDPAPTAGLAAFLLPDPGGAGPRILGDRDALIHARVRPRAGMDLAALVPEGGQGDRLFRLKSGLLSDAVLGGAFEIAVYLPAAGAALPPMAAALDIRSEALAREAVERFVGELSAQWPIHPTPVGFSSGAGACLFDLRILPEFAPCWLIRADALLLGWNPPSLERALAPASGPRDPDAPSRLSVRLDRMVEADRRLQAGAAPASAPLAATGWGGLEVTPGAGEAAFRVRLVARQGEP